MLEALKDDQEDEEIVDAERGLNGVAADPFERCLTALGNGDPGGEGGCGQHQDDRPEPGNGLGVPGLALVAGQQGIDQEQRRHHRMKPHPPDPRDAGNHY